MDKPIISEQLNELMVRCLTESEMIHEERKKELKLLAKMIIESIRHNRRAQLIFVCTHNSRRSQLAQIMLKTAAAWFGLHQKISTFSGGTEVTAFNERMVKAIESAGFLIEKQNAAANPEYQVHFSTENKSDEKYFSKIYDHTANPKEDFIAVMVCDHADANCPFIPGAVNRFSLPYLDPKAYDDTPEEALAYDEKVLEIGREMIYLAGLVKDAFSD